MSSYFPRECIEKWINQPGQFISCPFCRSDNHETDMEATISSREKISIIIKQSISGELLRLVEEDFRINDGNIIPLVGPCIIDSYLKSDSINVKYLTLFHLRKMRFPGRRFKQIFKREGATTLPLIIDCIRKESTFGMKIEALQILLNISRIDGGSEVLIKAGYLSSSFII